MIPITSAKAPLPLTLNKGFIKELNRFPIWFTMFVCIRSSVATKNGNSEGITLVANNVRPFFTAGRFDFENISNPAVNARNNNGIIFLFNFII